MNKVNEGEEALGVSKRDSAVLEEMSETTFEDALTETREGGHHAEEFSTATAAILALAQPTTSAVDGVNYVDTAVDGYKVQRPKSQQCPTVRQWVECASALPATTRLGWSRRATAPKTQLPALTSRYAFCVWMSSVLPTTLPLAKTIRRNQVANTRTKSNCLSNCAVCAALALVCKWRRGPINVLLHCNSRRNILLKTPIIFPISYQLKRHH
ncbi:uncharacterized protein [Dermacentor albipictus]|uniref:uncharacterized protein isoform X1 n=1 Tax=Dermacentor albipictus TaxID=60249 RepID=UPI0031FBE1BD